MDEINLSVALVCITSLISLTADAFHVLAAFAEIGRAKKREATKMSAMKGTQIRTKERGTKKNDRSTQSGHSTMISPGFAHVFTW